MENKNTVSARIGKEHYKTTLSALGNELIADEPEESGGGNLGFGPGYLVRAGLASCTAITLRMYADRKQFDVDEIHVDVYTEEVGTTTVFHRDIRVNGKLDDQQRERLLLIANKCPVHKMLTNPIEVETKLEVE